MAEKATVVRTLLEEAQNSNLESPNQPPANTSSAIPLPIGDSNHALDTLLHDFRYFKVIA